MHCTLLVTDLFWPGEAADAADRGLDLPTLKTALARARAERHPPLSREAWLCQAFEIERQQDWPVAPLTLALDGGEPGSAYWLRADPVHLQLQRDRVALMASDAFEIAQDEADAAVAALNAQFAADGFAFEARAPSRWYLRLDRAPALVTVTLSAAAGRDARDMQPTGADAAQWRRLTNEIQMLMHALPANEARAARGAPAINSVWLWGGGTKSAVPGRPFGAVWSDDALVQALGAHADAHATALPADGGAWLDAARRLPGERHHLVVLDGCARAATYGDLGGWRTAVAAVESDWLRPLIGAVRSGAIDRLVIAAPGAAVSWRFEITRSRLFRFWVPARALSAYGAR